MSASHDVLVRVVWGEGGRVLLWQRWEPAWHLARSFDEYAVATEIADEGGLDHWDYSERGVLPGSYGANQ